MNFDIIVPAYAECEGIDLTLDSIAKQTYPNFKTHVCFDCVAPDRERDIMREYKGAMDLSFHRSASRRLFALENILRVLDALKSESIIGVVDCADSLFRRDCLDLVQNEYSDAVKCVWTAHHWDKNGMNQSSPLNNMASPYQQPWASSHFRTFLLSYYRRVNKKNFLDDKGNFFKRTYDQALMLPIIHLVLSDGLRTKYIDEVCYIYRGNYEPMGEDNRYQLHLEQFIRDRGYIE